MLVIRLRLSLIDSDTLPSVIMLSVEYLSAAMMGIITELISNNAPYDLIIIYQNSFLIYRLQPSDRAFFSAQYITAHTTKKFTAHTMNINNSLLFCQRSLVASRPGGFINQHIKRACYCVKTDHITIFNFTQRAASQSLGAEVNGRRHLAGSAAHTAIGDDSHFKTFTLQHG